MTLVIQKMAEGKLTLYIQYTRRDGSKNLTVLRGLFLSIINLDAFI